MVQEFAEALSATPGVEHVLKFYDEHLLEENLSYMRELFVLEMRLRKALSVVYLAAYRDDYYDLLREENVTVADKEKPDERTIAQPLRK